MSLAPSEFSTPVLFLIFNRPEQTQLSFNILKELRPAQLFIAGDGPRKGYNQDVAAIAACQSIVTAIDWNCEVKTFYRSTNLGCGKAVSTAIDWFFEQVNAGIILEDDVLPDKSFFYFCATLLERYEADESVMHISGCYFLTPFIAQPQASYYYTKHVHVWGWATWKRAWKHYDYALKADWLHQLRRQLKSYYGGYYPFWQHIFDSMVKQKIDTWDYQWMYAIGKNNGIGINPAVNLVSNIGFDQQATHTKTPNVILTALSRSAIIHTHSPDELLVDSVRDDLYYRHFLNYDLHVRQTILWRLKKLAGKLRAIFRS